MGKIIGLVPGVPLLVVAIWHLLSIATAIAFAVFLAERIELPFHRWLLQRVKKLLEIGQTNSTLDGSEFSIPFRYLPSDKKKGFVQFERG
jgi:hypothetical protein